MAGNGRGEGDWGPPCPVPEGGTLQEVFKFLAPVCALQAKNKWQACLEFRVMFGVELHMFLWKHF